MVIDVVDLLIGFFVFAVIAIGARYALAYLQAAQEIRWIVMALLTVVFVIWLLQELQITGPVLRID